MSEIALYDILRKIDGVSPEQAKEAVADVAKAGEVATKDYIDAAIAKLETRLTWRLVIAISIAVGIIKYL